MSIENVDSAPQQVPSAKEEPTQFRVATRLQIGYQVSNLFCRASQTIVNANEITTQNLRQSFFP